MRRSSLAACWYPSISVVVLSVGLSVCPLLMTVYCGRTDEAIELLFGLLSGVDPSDPVLDGRAHWRHLANTVERLCAAAMNESATRDGDEACFQITSGILVIIIRFRSFMFLRLKMLKYTE